MSEKTYFPQIKPMTRTVAILVFPEFQLLDAAGPITAFEEARNQTAPPAYRLRVMARVSGPVNSSSGLQMVAEDFTDDPIDTLIIAGGRGTLAVSACSETLAYVREVAQR